jgi:gas vesicle protein
MHFGNLAAGIGGVFGVIVLLAAALAVARANYAKAQIMALRGDRDDLQERATRQDREIQILKQRIGEAETARRVLERAVTGRDLMESLRDELNAHNKAAMDGLQKIYTAIEELTDVIEQIQRGTR